jgi:hypothetical protein
MKEDEIAKNPILKIILNKKKIAIKIMRTKFDH